MLFKMCFFEAIQDLIQERGGTQETGTSVFRLKTDLVVPSE